MTRNDVWTFWENAPLLKLVWCQNFFGLVTCSGVGGFSVFCCGSYEASFAELEPQYALERSENVILQRFL